MPECIKYHGADSLAYVVRLKTTRLKSLEHTILLSEAFHTLHMFPNCFKINSKAIEVNGIKEVGKFTITSFFSKTVEKN